MQQGELQSKIYANDESQRIGYTSYKSPHSYPTIKYSLKCNACLFAKHDFLHADASFLE